VHCALLTERRRRPHLPAPAWAALAAWAAVWTLPHLDHSALSWRFFALGGHLLTRPGIGGGLHVYGRHPVLQIGPLALAAAAGFDSLGGAGRLCAVLVLATIGLVLVAVVERTRVADVAVTPRRLLLCAVLFLPVWMELAFHYTHLDDGLALLFAALAVQTAAKDRPVWTGVLLALAADSKPWAVAFVPLLLAVGRHGRTRAFAAWAVGLAAAWAPFLLADTRTLTAAKFAIPNTATSALRALGVTSSGTPTWDRPAQFLLGALVAAVAVKTGRWPAALFAALSIRILLDPGTYAYYTAGLVLAAVYVDLFLARRAIPLFTAFAVAGVYALRATPVDLGTLGAIRAGYCLLGLAALFRLTPSVRSANGRTSVRVPIPTRSMP